MVRTKGFVAFKRLFLLGLVWLGLTGADPEGLALGLLAVPAATWLSLALLPPGKRQVSIMVLLRLAPAFLWRSVLGGLDVAWRAFHPALPLRPAWLELPVRLPAGPPRVALGGEFSLLPGSLVAGTRGDVLLVHALDADQDVAGAVALAEAELAQALTPGEDPA